MDKVFRNKRAVFLFLLPSLVLFAMIIVAPVILSAYYSTLEWNGAGAQTSVGVSNYIRLFHDPLFMQSVLHTLVFAAASLCIQLPFALLLALLLTGPVKKERFFTTVYFIPVILSSVVIGHLWMRIYHMNNGLLNVLLRTLGFQNLGRTAWLGDIRYALGAVVTPVLWQYTGYHMLLFYSGIRSVPTDIYEAARIDGAGFMRTAGAITLPLLKPIIQVCVTFAAVGSMKVYDLVKVLTDGGPFNATDVMTTLLVRTMIYPGNNYGYGSAMAMILIAVCFILYHVLGWLFREPAQRSVRRGWNG